MTLQQNNLVTLRAQTTSEYLILLGIVLVLLSIIGINIFGFPDILMSYKDNTNNKYWESQDIAIVSPKNEGSNVSLLIRNSLPYNITINSFQLGGEYIEILSIIEPNYFLNISILRSGTLVPIINYTDERNQFENILTGPEISLINE